MRAMNAADLIAERQPLGAPARPGFVAPDDARDQARSFEVRWARNERDVSEAQRLRYQVFADEMGARLAPMLGAPPLHDVDRFDEHCEHLLVRARLPGSGDRCAIGTYRVLTPVGALRAGGLYSDDEFDLTPVDALRPLMLELGRSCIDPAFRQGAVVMLLWSNIVSFMQRNGLRWAIGCASVPMRDGGHAAASLWRGLCATHLAAPEFRVLPRRALPVDQLRQDLKVEAPPLIKGYLRCGAQLLGPPAWDPEFGTADLPLLIDLNAMSDRYRRHFIGD
jgi:putative hemolysin